LSRNPTYTVGAVGVKDEIKHTSIKTGIMLLYIVSGQGA